jgi:biopolymer transport protein ExbD
MVVRFRCPSCGKRLKADGARAGRTSVCPRCSTTVTVPAADEAEATAPGDNEPAAFAGAKPASEHPLMLVKPVPRHNEDLIDMTAMVDIVFFLLIFFMVTSMQAVQSVIGLPTPQAQSSAMTAVSDLTEVPNYITVNIYEDDTVWVEETEVYGAQDLRTRLRDAMKTDPTLDGMLVVGSPDASHGAFVMVLDAGGDAGLTKLMFSVPDEMEAVQAGG